MENPEDGTQCDCGYHFETKTLKELKNSTSPHGPEHTVLHSIVAWLCLFSGALLYLFLAASTSPKLIQTRRIIPVREDVFRWDFLLWYFLGLILGGIQSFCLYHYLKNPEGIVLAAFPIGFSVL